MIHSLSFVRSFVHSFLRSFFCSFFRSFFLCRATPEEYGGSQARGQIRAVVTGLYHSHNNAGSKPCLWYFHGIQWYSYICYTVLKTLLQLKNKKKKNLTYDNRLMGNFSSYKREIYAVGLWVFSNYHKSPKMFHCILFLFTYIFISYTPMLGGSSWAWYRTHATVEPEPLQWQCWILNLLSHNGTYSMCLLKKLLCKWTYTIQTHVVQG